MAFIGSSIQPPDNDNVFDTLQPLWEGSLTQNEKALVYAISVLHKQHEKAVSELRKEIWSDFKDELLLYMREELWGDFKDELQHDCINAFMKKLKQELKNELREEMKEEVRLHVKTELRDELLKEIDIELRNELDNYLPE